MKCLTAILCLTALTGQLMAEQSDRDVVFGMNAMQGNYPAVEAFLRRIYPDANIQIGTNGSITLHESGQNFLALESSNTMTLQLSFSLKNDPAYAQNLPIRHFILTELQMAQFFSNPSLRPEPLDFFGLSESKLYLVIQIKNKGPRFASGTLYFPFFHKSFSISVDIEANMEEFSTYVVPLGITKMENFKDIKDISDRLGDLLWNKVSVGLTEEEILNSLERFLAFTEFDQYGTDEDPEEVDQYESDDDLDEEESRFPIFRDTE